MAVDCKEHPGLPVLLKELRSEYRHIHQMEARLHNQRLKWMQSVEKWLAHQEWLAKEQMGTWTKSSSTWSAANTQLGRPRPWAQSADYEAELQKTPLALADQQGKATGEFDLELEEPNLQGGSAGSPVWPISAFGSDLSERRPGPRLCPPLPDVETSVQFEPDLPEGNDMGNDMVTSLALEQWTPINPVFQDQTNQHGLEDTGRASQRASTSTETREGRRPAKNNRSSADSKYKSLLAHDRKSLLQFSPAPGQSRLACMVMHPLFDSTCAFMIVFNSAIIGASVQHLTEFDQETDFMVTAGVCCSVFFLLELIMRMAQQGKSFFQNENRRWNIFDLCLVVFSVVDFFPTSSTQTSSLSSNLKTVKMLRIVRVVRVFRFFRELSLLAMMIVDSLFSLGWALILLGLIIYIFGICFTSMASTFLKDEANHQNLMRSEVERQFGTLLRTVYTLLLSMLGGVSWGVASDALLEVHELAFGMFFFYVAFTILAVMNIITGVFVDNAVETARTQRDFLIQKEMELKEKYAAEMRGLFQQMDADGSGTISFDEVTQYLEDERVQGYFAALGLDPNDTERLFRLIDDDGSGDVDVGEFLDGCIRLKGQARSIDVYSIMRNLKEVEIKIDAFMEFIQKVNERASKYLPEDLESASDSGQIDTAL